MEAGGVTTEAIMAEVITTTTAIITATTTPVVIHITKVAVELQQDDLRGGIALQTTDTVM